MKTMGVRRVSTADKIDEEIRRNGFSIIRGVFKPGFVEAVKMAGLEIFFRQQESFKKRSQELKLHPVDASNPLNSIGDVGICRALRRSSLFRDQMLLNPAYLNRIKTHLDDEFVCIRRSWLSATHRHLRTSHRRVGIEKFSINISVPA